MSSAMTAKIDELKSFLPTYEDLTGSVNALLRLQDTYKLDTTDLAQGNVGGVQSSQLTGTQGVFTYSSIIHSVVTYLGIIPSNIEKLAICLMWVLF